MAILTLTVTCFQTIAKTHQPVTSQRRFNIRTQLVFQEDCMASGKIVTMYHSLSSSAVTGRDKKDKWKVKQNWGKTSIRNKRRANSSFPRIKPSR